MRPRGPRRLTGRRGPEPKLPTNPPRHQQARPAELGVGGPRWTPTPCPGSPALGEMPQPRGREAAQPPHPLPGLGPQGRGPRKQLQGSLPTASAESLRGTGGTGAPALPSHPCPPTRPTQQAARGTGAPRPPGSASRPGATAAHPPAAQDARPAGPWRPGHAAWGGGVLLRGPLPRGSSSGTSRSRASGSHGRAPVGQVCREQRWCCQAPGRTRLRARTRRSRSQAPRPGTGWATQTMCRYVLRPGPDMPGAAGGAQQGLPPGTGLQIHRPGRPCPAAPPRPMLPEPGALTTTVMPSFSRGALS